MTDFNEISYEAHKKHFQNQNDIPPRLKNKNNIDYWRHERMYNLLMPLCRTKSRWLTIGDGFGIDANWLEGKKQKVVASDISDQGLKMAREEGYISEYRLENAEDLNFADNSFEYVLCKEAYHHFPRPLLAVYEMIRVSSNGIVLIEPVDIGIQFPIVVFLKNLIERFSTSFVKKLWKNRFSFEKVGNYVYKVSEREIEKIAMGMNLPVVAFKGVNDYYDSHMDLQVSKDHPNFKKVKFRIQLKNILCRLGLIPYELEAFIIFKSNPSNEVLEALKNQGYKILMLPANPYLSSSSRS